MQFIVNDWDLKYIAEFSFGDIKSQFGHLRILHFSLVQSSHGILQINVFFPPKLVLFTG